MSDYELIEVSIGNYRESIPVDYGKYTFGNQPRKGYVYIISDGYAVKIGITSDLEQRIGTLRGSNPRPIEILQSFEVEDPGMYEQSLHDFYSDYRIKGEWFDLLQIFGIGNGIDERLYSAQKEIETLKKKLRRANRENSRWRNAKYSRDDKYCSQCGHILEKWFEKEADDGSPA